jgi:hypothetical protein
MLVLHFYGPYSQFAVGLLFTDECIYDGYPSGYAMIKAKYIVIN